MRPPFTAFLWAMLLLTHCNQATENVYQAHPNNPLEVIKDTLALLTPFPQKITKNRITLTFSYAAIACGCPQWFETKYKKVEYLGGVERFYLEPSTEQLVNANDLWDGAHLPLTVRVTGYFSAAKEAPVTYSTKGLPEKARIFWYDQITRLSDP